MSAVDLMEFEECSQRRLANSMVHLKVFEAFAGVGSQHMALRNLGVDYEVVGVSEIDKFAHQSYEAIHGETKNFGDISKLKPEDLPDFDLFTYSFPCTDLSSAGKQRGFEKGSGTSSSLLWECQRIIEGKKPKALLLENVKALNSAKFRDGFHSWLSFLRGLGYTNYYGVLNAKDFGLPQNRERIFVVSILGKHKPYRFPNGFDDGSTMAPLLGSELDTKKWHKQYNIDRFTYELRDKGIVHYLGRFNVPLDYKLDKLKEQGLADINPSTIKESIGMRTQCLFPTGKVSCMLASDYKYPKTVVEGVGCEVPSKLYPSDASDPLARPFVKYERGLSSTREELAKDPNVLWLSEKTANKPQGLFNLALMLSDNQTEEQKPLNGFYTMRYLTPPPGECWKFMGFSYEDYQKAKETGLSDLQLYKQAGNSIAVPCLEVLFKRIYESLED